MASDDDLSNRQKARSEARKAGDRSAELARELMSVAAWMLARLELDDDLLAAITKARAVTAQVARRRAERTLAGDLRGADLAALKAKLASVRTTGSADAERQHAAERWRNRLLDEGDAAIAAFSAFIGGDPDHELPGLIARAQRERATGKPAGAGRALYRYIMEELKSRAAREPDAAGEP